MRDSFTIPGIHWMGGSLARRDTGLRGLGSEDPCNPYVIASRSLVSTGWEAPRPEERRGEFLQVVVLQSSSKRPTILVIIPLELLVVRNFVQQTHVNHE
jgi:hypothetical protein